MFRPEVTAFVEGGSGLIVGTVANDGAPLANRAWGLTVLDHATGDVRVLLDAGDLATLANLEATPAIAITATDVRTLRSLQMKGIASTIEPATEADAERSARYCDAFFTDIEEIDRIPRELPARLTPDALVACIIRIRDLFDQTPGPVAGARVEHADG